MNSEKLEPLLSPLWVSVILVIILLIIFAFCLWVSKKYSTKTAAFIFVLMCIPTVGYANLIVGSPATTIKEPVVGGEFNPVADTVEPTRGAIDPQDQEISEMLNELDELDG